MHDIGARLCNPHIARAHSHNFGTPALNFGIKVVFGDELIDPTKVHSLLALYLRQRNYASSAYFSPAVITNKFFPPSTGAPPIFPPFAELGPLGGDGQIASDDQFVSASEIAAVN